MRGSINAHFESYGELNLGGMEHPDCQSVTIGQYADGYGDVTLFLTPAQIVQIRDHFTVLAADILLTDNEAEVLEHAADNVRDSDAGREFTPSEAEAIHLAMVREEQGRQSEERGE